jgi:serine/threonine-protein kinase HipA
MADTAYVFIYLPGDLLPTLAGRFDLEEVSAVGHFVYGESYLANPAALPIDPIALPRREQIFTTTLGSGFFGVFRDAIPDDWGRHVAGKLYGDNFRTLFEYLWLHTSDRMGALAFGRTVQQPVAEKPLLAWPDIERTVYLEAMQKLDRDIPLTPAEEEVAVVFGAGTSAGGARPKFTVQRNKALWLAKLNRRGDRFNQVRVEAGMLDLAAACGISVPEHNVQRVHDQDVLLTKRFDRAITADGVSRYRMVSAGTVFQSDEAVAKYSYTGSYPRFSRELARWTNTSDQDRRELFRRIAFNALTSTTDDHERNHALVAENDHFRLSPAFDLVPAPGGTRKRYLALVIGEYGALAIRENLLSSAEVFQLTSAEANQMIHEVQQIVRKEWAAKLAARGVSNADIKMVSSCFDPPFFESAAPDGPTL